MLLSEAEDDDLGADVDYVELRNDLWPHSRFKYLILKNDLHAHLEAKRAVDRFFVTQWTTDTHAVS